MGGDSESISTWIKLRINDERGALNLNTSKWSKWSLAYASSLPNIKTIEIEGDHNQWSNILGSIRIDTLSLLCTNPLIAHILNMFS